MRYALAVASTLLAFAGQATTADYYAPAKLVEGGMPPGPGDRTPTSVQGAMTLGGGEVLLDVTVGPDGHVRNINRVRVTPPYTDQLISAVEGWRFMPAEAASAREPRHPIETHVLVAGLYRPPALYAGTTAGEVPKDVGRASDAIPVPREIVTPPYPPTARGSGVALLEVEVGTDGSPGTVRVVRSAGIFDSAAIQAVERWTFSPARMLDGPAPSFAYVLVGFLEPVATQQRR